MRAMSLTPPPTTPLVELVELWWTLIGRILAFLTGAGILVWETVAESTDRLYLTVAAVGLCGPAVAQSVAAVFAAIRGTSE